ncbi:sugar transporter [Advenella sp. S44]|uniref:polysaccharide biosynthesis/export family protein n=1 Tax=Advenella sp. S44 TaxID=1982755 RepID=UPI000C2A5896|nr:polysaccharide biosynthesis/export family protein [Advenella sp. S44]PJX27629.1 sugar transporter [Advenella sp. S44]
MQSLSFSFGSTNQRLFFKTLSAIGVLVMLAGCGSILSGTGPYSSAITSSSAGQDPALPYSLIDLAPDNIAEYSRKAPPPASAKVSKTGTTSIQLIPGDVIKIMISDSAEGGVFAPLSAGGTIFNNVRVSSDGTISLPYVGTVNVRGFTLTQVDNSVRKKLKGAAATDPQVHSEMVGDLSGSVLVAGAVKTPGRFSSLQGPLTILDAVNMAGGPVLEPHLINVVVRNGKSAYSVNYDDVLGGKNRQVSPRSEIILERARQRFVAMGSVKEPGLKDLPARNPSLLEVLGSVGGLDEQKADPQGVFVFRINQEPKEGQPAAEVFKLDMRRPEAIFLARAFQVFPDDAVYVTNAPVYEWQKIISPIVQTLVLGRTLSRL